jgi:Flp pilus assembly protein TadG
MKRQRSSKHDGRKGTALIELAACLPVIVLLVAGSIECCGLIFLKQTLCAAAYEGIRVAVRQDATPADVNQRATEVLAARNIQNATVTIDPPDIGSLVPGDLLTVTVSAPTTGNRVIITRYVQDVTVSSSVLMLKE